MNQSISSKIAKDLLNVKAVSLSPHKPYNWSSGIKSPIYTDNRITISYPTVRNDIAEELANLIQNKFPEVNVIGGVATAGIPHAALVAEKLNLPMIYVRSKPKDHGQGKQMEGFVDKNAKVVLIDDLLSTGNSVLNSAKYLINHNINVLGVAAIFTYGLPDSVVNFKKAEIKFDTLTDYPTIIEQAKIDSLISKEDSDSLKAWHQDPWNWK
ncbi:orotate phosphoribosyltransferase [Apilactobacillus quenuiae]|uniref:orotate phosphoribosyltransferase n=1 Tax=Apilactobacillus quenuiae TaxID=2008377 RepID=UPI000D015A0E|nr:orotate phosphoribosyltransferase [Apilactobacillus quenuiae]